MSYLFLYLGITIIGFLIGSQLKKRGIALPWVSPMQTAVIIVLVFLMGSRIGSNEEIVASLDTIGLISFAYTIIIFATTVLTYSVVRRLLGFNRYGIRHADAGKRRIKDGEAAADEDAGNAGNGSGQTPQAAKETQIVETTAAADRSAEPETKQKQKGLPKINSLTLLILVFVTIGILAGYFLLPAGFIKWTGQLLTISLCVLLVLIGIDIGTAGTLKENFRSAGWRVLVFPFCCMAGMVIGSFVAAAVLPLGVQDCLCVGSGFAWYSLAPVMLAEYSTRISAISFMHNVFREILGMLLVPVVARRIGYIESYSLPGSTSMDVCLPVIERATSSDVAVYSFINGAIVSASVPVLVSIFMSL